ncbi:HAD-superfamily hydrolase subfamily IIB [Trichophyton equinum CBS 127.97]|uniref:HAD-superfamily hydrolase subfamily IIB n=1 Tax=Trichophyton equinum (strain ATCC MYA-4606 / CBS 127.97) TaxID=559882 RepID=F2PJA0_TRIEC|nr:HAD-superfamily hydrolase subfamily IIB [Trichophyton equinum CBS 127.97]
MISLVGFDPDGTLPSANHSHCWTPWESRNLLAVEHVAVISGNTKSENGKQYMLDSLIMKLSFDNASEATGLKPEQIWGNRIEYRGSWIVIWALGQETPSVLKKSGILNLASEKQLRRIYGSASPTFQSTWEEGGCSFQ